MRLVNKICYLFIFLVVVVTACLLGAVLALR